MDEQVESKSDPRFILKSTQDSLNGGTNIYEDELTGKHETKLVVLIGQQIEELHRQWQDGEKIPEKVETEIRNNQISDFITDLIEQYPNAPEVKPVAARIKDFMGRFKTNKGKENK